MVLVLNWLHFNAQFERICIQLHNRHSHCIKCNSYTVNLFIKWMKNARKLLHEYNGLVYYTIFISTPLWATSMDRKEYFRESACKTRSAIDSRNWMKWYKIVNIIDIETENSKNELMVENPKALHKMKHN